MSKRHFETLSFSEKMSYMIDVLGYDENDFEMYNQSYKMFDSLTPEQKLEAVAYSAEVSV